jgi:hypothetical protein
LFKPLKSERSSLATEIEASHEETKPATMKLDEQQVNDLIDHIRYKMTDLFDVALHPAPLINISTGMHASKDVQDSLLNSIDEGTWLNLLLKVLCQMVSLVVSIIRFEVLN